MRNLREKWVWKPQPPRGASEALVLQRWVCNSLTWMLRCSEALAAQIWGHSPCWGASLASGWGKLSLAPGQTFQGSGDASRKALRRSFSTCCWKGEASWIKAKITQHLPSSPQSSIQPLPVPQHPHREKFFLMPDLNLLSVSEKPLPLFLSLQALVNRLSACSLGAPFGYHGRQTHCRGGASPANAAPELLSGRGWGSALCGGSFAALWTNLCLLFVVMIVFDWRLPSSELVPAAWRVRNPLCSFLPRDSPGSVGAIITEHLFHPSISAGRQNPSQRKTSNV